MAKMWAGRSTGVTDSLADDFDSSIRFDRRLYKYDIKGSIAHAKMLAKQGIIKEEERDQLISGLTGIEEDLSSGKLDFDDTCEDIHMFIEQTLTERLGDVGKKVHTARSRNDQIALDMRMYMKDVVKDVRQLLVDLVGVLTDTAEANKHTVMPGYTHLQRAQPIVFGHQMMAYAMMFLRDMDRLSDMYKRVDVSPIGACALAGTTYNTDRRYEADLLGFSDIAMNSIDAVSDRDFCIEFLSCVSMVMMHLSRLSEEIVMWSSWEFRFITLSDDYTTGSSIMPQKKNPDMAELIRGKTGRVYGELMGLLTTFKGLPLAYDKDMQEDKEGVFDAIDNVEMCLKVMIPMLKTMKVNEKNMHEAAKKGFINATDLADYLVKKGLPFRSAYKISGSIVRYCIEHDKVLEDLSLEEYKGFDDHFDEDLYDAIDLKNCVEKRISEGGTSPHSVENQIKYVKNILTKTK